jgi:hypothetical protein
MIDDCALLHLYHIDPPLRSFWELVHASDHDQLSTALGQLVLSKSGAARLRCRIRTSFADYFLPLDVAMQYGSLGIVCSLWKPV